MNSNRKIDIGMRIFGMLFLITVALLCACSDDDKETESKNTKRLTVGTWVIQSVTLNTTDNTNLFTGLSVTFSAAAYTATNVSPVWPTSGTWAFNNSTQTLMLRDGSLAVVIDELTENKLVLSPHWSEPGVLSKTTSITGDYVFTFSR